jgi:hypothetical protein
VSVVSEIEQGKKEDPSMSTVQALAEALDVDCTALTASVQHSRLAADTLA